MQQSIRAPASTCSSPLCNSRRLVTRTPAFTSHTPNGRTLSVQVFAAKKGKGKSTLRAQPGIPGQMDMVRRDPPTPEVDPENAEFVIFVRCKKFMDPIMQKVTTGTSAYIPLSIVKGGQGANFLVQIVSSEWGRKLYGKTLISQIARSIYKERAEIERNVRKNYPPFANAGSKDFEYAFKIRDKSEPKDWLKTDDVIVFPPEEELESTGLDQLRKFFSPDSIASMFKSADAPPAPSSSNGTAPQQ